MVMEKTFRKGIIEKTRNTVLERDKMTAMSSKRIQIEEATIIAIIIAIIIISKNI